VGGAGWVNDFSPQCPFSAKLPIVPLLGIAFEIFFGQNKRMKIPRYWSRANYEMRDARGDLHTFCGLSWSSQSPEDARAKAMAQAESIGAKFVGGVPLSRYEYGRRPRPEPVVEEISLHGSVVACITRNRYGALVLNCPDTLFVDIDFPPPTLPSALSSFLNLFRSSRENPGPDKHARETLSKISQWSKSNSSYAFRVYRTHAGLRVVFTDKLYAPDSPEVSLLFEQLGADPLYARLTRYQDCFRARLTPKPWRISVPNISIRYPWRSPEEENTFARWEEGYQKASVKYRTCSLLRKFGPLEPEDPRIAKVVEIHDSLSGVNTLAPLG